MIYFESFVSLPGTHVLPCCGTDAYPTNPYVNDPVDFTNPKSTPATSDHKGLFPLKIANAKATTQTVNL